MKRRRFLALALFSSLMLSSCSEEVKCDVEDEHIHYYKTISGIERLIEGEREHRGEYERCEAYVLRSIDYQLIVDNHLCILDDNLEYVQKRFENRPDGFRLEKKSKFIPSHYELKYDVVEGMGGFTFEIVPDSYEYYWEEIAIDEHTENPVKDVSYGILLYRIKEDGTLESKVFVDLDSVEQGYAYFKTGTLITKIVGEEYYLEKQSSKKKSHFKTYETLLFFFSKVIILSLSL